MSDDKMISENVRRNVRELCSDLNLQSIAELAEYIEKPVSTVYNYIQHPRSNSSVKSILANLAGVTVRQFENEDLRDIKRASSYQDGPPLSSPVLTPYQQKAFSLLMDPANADGESQVLSKATRKFIIDNGIDIQKRLDTAVKKYEEGRYPEAMFAFESILFILTKEKTEILNDDFLNKYFDACYKTNLVAGIYALKDRILEGDLHDLALATYFRVCIAPFDEDMATEIMSTF